MPLEINIILLTLCFRGQHTFFVFEAEYVIWPYLARSCNLFDLRLIGRSIDGPWLVFLSLRALMLLSIILIPYQLYLAFL
jgi:hypothetical protein